MLLPPLKRGEAGFSLVLVIWGAGLISLLVLASVAAARWRLMASASAAGAVQAASLAEAAGTIAAHRLAAGGGSAQGARVAADGSPVFCGLPGGVTAAVAIEDEGGKVDLNGAPPKLLEALFTGFGVEAGTAADIARAIVDFRSANPRGIGARGAVASSDGAKHALFQTVYELDQITAFPPGLVRDLAPYVTVSPARAGLDPGVAPPALFAALSGATLDDVRALAAAPYPNRLDRTDPRFPLAFIQGTPGGVYLVHAEVVIASGVTAVREQLVDVHQGVRVVERRGGAARFAARLRELLAAGSATLPPC